MALGTGRRIPEKGMRAIQFAEWYVTELGWKIFPLAPMSKEPLFRSPHSKGHKCKGECGKLGHGVYDATSDLATVQDWWKESPTANIGLAVPEGCIAVDVDGRNDGPLTITRLERQHGALPSTVTNLTGSGNNSAHYLLTVPHDRLLRGTFNAEDYPGLDLKKHPGGYLVVPPSIHPDGGRYIWRSGYDPEDIAVAAAPGWLLDLLTQPSTGHANGMPFDPQTIVKKGARNNAYFTFVQHYHRLGVTEAPLRLMADEYNTQQLDPPLDEVEAEDTFLSACSYEQDAQFMVSNGAPPGPNTAPPGQSNMYATQPQTNLKASTAWMQDLFIYAKSGELKQNAFNIGQILRNHPYWRMPERVLWYDVIRGYHMCGNDQISKALATKATQWFGGQMRLAISNIDLLKLCLEAEAGDNHVDLLQHQLLALPPWDDHPRLSTWLHEVTGAEDRAYTRYLSQALLVSMVARVLQPGCPCRLVVILEGKENIGKSHLVEALASSEWYTILSMSLEGKDSHIMLHKYWLAEFAELDSLSRTEEARMKAFVTMETDTYVPKYSNVAVSIPRRTIFMGTTNDSSGYLKGQTGNTRYYPLPVGERIDVDRFLTLRPQLFAEAMVWYGTHQATWWQEPEEITITAAEERELRRAASDYEQPLHEWLEFERHNDVIYDDGKPVHFTRHETAWPEIARWFLKIAEPERWKDRSLQMQIAMALKALGWKSKPIWRYGRTTRIWCKDEITD